MIINITQHCTLRCSHCMQNAGPERNEMMSKDMFLQALQFAKNIGSNAVMVSGGEPTSHPDFFYFLEVLVKSRRCMLLSARTMRMNESSSIALKLATPF